MFGIVAASRADPVWPTGVLVLPQRQMALVARPGLLAGVERVRAGFG